MFTAVLNENICFRGIGCPLCYEADEILDIFDENGFLLKTGDDIPLNIKAAIIEIAKQCPLKAIEVKDDGQWVAKVN